MTRAKRRIMAGLGGTLLGVGAVLYLLAAGAFVLEEVVLETGILSELRLPGLGLLRALCTPAMGLLRELWGV